MKKIKPEFIGLGVIALALIGIVAFALTRPATSTDTSSSASSSSKFAPTQNKGKSLSALNKVALPQLTTKVSADESEVIMHTSEGDITLKLFNKYAPLAVYNFMALSKEGYYNGVTFHRVIKDFMIQGGDPEGTGAGGHSIWYETEKNTKIDSGNGFKNEVSSSLYNIRGALAMANAGADTNGSQFFINQNSNNQQKTLDKSAYPTKIYKAYKNGGNPNLDGSYTVFGQVVSGMDVVDKIASVKVGGDQNSTPETPIKIDSIDVVQEAPVDISAATK